MIILEGETPAYVHYSDQIAKLVANGMTIKDAARELNISKTNAQHGHNFALFGLNTKEGLRDHLASQAE